MTRVGFVGLGNIGAPLAMRLIDNPDGLVVYDVRAEATAPFAERGAIVAGSAAELAAGCGLISVMVLDDPQVRDVVTALLTSAEGGTVIAIHSTISVQTAIDVAAQAESVGVQVVDAPVSGGPVGAAEGRLAVMVGGERAAYDRCKEVFGSWAELVLHVGPVGAGTRTKVARNLVQFVGYGAASEAQRLAEAAGIDLRKLAAVVRHSDGLTGGVSAIMFRDNTSVVAADDPARSILEHTYTLGAKDLDLAVAMAAELGVAAPFSSLARERLASALGLEADS